MVFVALNAARLAWSQQRPAINPSPHRRLLVPIATSPPLPASHSARLDHRKRAGRLGLSCSAPLRACRPIFAASSTSLGKVRPAAEQQSHICCTKVITARSDGVSTVRYPLDTALASSLLCAVVGGARVALLHHSPQPVTAPGRIIPRLSIDRTAVGFAVSPVCRTPP